MSTFDPYHKWLSIPESEQPPHHYRLLGVVPFEPDPDVIEAAADRQMTYIRGCAAGPHVEESQQLLNEISAARICLLNPAKKQAYDSELKARISSAPAEPSGPAPALKHVTSGSPVASPPAPDKSGSATAADVAQQERRARKLMDEQNFNSAIPILVKLAELEGALYKTTSEWAQAELPRAKQKQEKLRERVRAACEKARALLKTYTYGEAAQLLEEIPAGARSEEANRILSEAGEKFEESMGLLQEIESAVKGKNYERLLPLVKRYLKLRPDSSKMQRLAVNLARSRPDRAVRNFKGTGKYFDVAGYLVDVKDLVLGLGFIAALYFGVSYGIRNYGDHIRNLANTGSPSFSSADRVPPSGDGQSPQSKPTTTSDGVPSGQSSPTAVATPKRVGAEEDSADGLQPVMETWITSDGWVISPGNPKAVYTLSDHPPGEYTVSLRARRLTGKSMFAIGLPVGDQQVLVALDADAGTVSGLEYLDGNPVNNNGSTRHGRLLLADKEVTIKCTVRKNGISCACGGVNFLDWRGDLGRLSVPPDFAVADKKSLFLATVASRVAISDVKVLPAEETSAAAWEKEASALAGEWTLARGLSNEGLRESWQVRNNDGQWSVNRSFTDPSGKQVGAAVSITCKFSGGELQFTERWEKKPVSNYGDGGTIILRFANAALDRLDMSWTVGGFRGGEALVRAGAIASKVVDEKAFIGTWGRSEGANRDGFIERWEIKKVKGEWFVKRTYLNKAGKVVGYSVSENLKFEGGVLRYTERLKQKPNPIYPDGASRVIQIDPESSDRLVTVYSYAQSSGSESLVRTSTK